jgi:hypothetical protein
MRKLQLASAVFATTTLLLIEKSRLYKIMEPIDDTGLRAGFRFAVMAVGVAMRVYHSIRGRNAHARRSSLSFFLYRLEMIAQILDTLANRRLIVAFEVLEDGAPHRHLGRTVSRIAGTEPKDVGDVFPGKVSAMRSSECRQIRRRFAERRRDGAAASAVGAMARRTVFPVHLATGRNICGRKLDLAILWSG